jgi:hypothetical protein
MIGREWRAAARLSAALLALPPLFGCGAPALAPVSGRVTCDGKPLPLGTILFSPLPASGTDLESPKAAGGGISNGRFEYVTTFKQGDGAFIGKHRVMVTMEFPESCPCLPTKEIILEIQPGHNDLVIELRDHSLKRKK